VVRIFTINFTFEGKVESAIVRMTEPGYNIIFRVHVFNEELHTYLPYGNLEFSLADWVSTTTADNEKSRKLVASIADEISKHLDYRKTESQRQVAQSNTGVLPGDNS
jgi:hypothetical protein